MSQVNVIIFNRTVNERQGLRVGVTIRFKVKIKAKKNLDVECVIIVVTR